MRGFCGLCGGGELTFVCRDKRRPFYLCGDCQLITVPQNYRLSTDGERARYDLHDNTNSNDGYVKFLSQVADVVASLSRPGMSVLDFGSGKNAVLSRLLSDGGISCYAYDPLYERPLPDVHNYDVVILCEVIEHVRDIAAELKLIQKLTRDGGATVIRTQLYDSPSAFPHWWYAQDPTHINFFNANSLQKTASTIGKTINATKYPDIFVLR